MITIKYNLIPLLIREYFYSFVESNYYHLKNQFVRFKNNNYLLTGFIIHFPNVIFCDLQTSKSGYFAISWLAY